MLSETTMLYHEVAECRQLNLQFPRYPYLGQPLSLTCPQPHYLLAFLWMWMQTVGVKQAAWSATGARLQGMWPNTAPNTSTFDSSQLRRDGSTWRHVPQWETHWRLRPRSLKTWLREHQCQLSQKPRVFTITMSEPHALIV